MSDPNPNPFPFASPPPTPEQKTPEPPRKRGRRRGKLANAAEPKTPRKRGPKPGTKRAANGAAKPRGRPRRDRHVTAMHDVKTVAKVTEQDIDQAMDTIFAALEFLRRLPVATRNRLLALI